MGDVTILTGTGGRELGRAASELAGLARTGCRIERFPDGEIDVELEASVRGRTAVIVQSTSPPVQERLVELLALADACRRDGAGRVVAVVPYFGYARADVRRGRRAPLMSRLVADLMEAAGIEGVVTVDAHRPQLEGCFRVPLVNLSAVEILAGAVEGRVEEGTVVVSPDRGAAELAAAYAGRLGLETVVLEKRRTGGSQVEAAGLTGGEVDGRPCLIVDDMVTTGGTVEEAVRVLREAGARPPFMLAATHPLLVGDAARRLPEAGVKRLVTTDSVPAECPRPGWLDVWSLAPLVAEVAAALGSGGRLVPVERRTVRSEPEGEGS